jgi:hypothetical protein
VALPDTKLARNRHAGDYSREASGNALASPLGRKTPYAWMWQLGSERIVGNPYLTQLGKVCPSLANVKHRATIEDAARTIGIAS